MLSSNAYMRIKANAEVFGIDLTAADDNALLSIVQTAQANEWSIVEDLIKAVAK